MNNIKSKREEMKISQEKLAKIIDCSYKTIQNIENGGITDIVTAYKLKNALNCKLIEEIFPEKNYIK